MPDTEIVPAPIPVAVGVRLEGLDEAFRLSKNLALAQTMPDALRGKPSDVLAIVLYGQELGLAPMQAIQGIYVVKGKPQLAAQTWIALAHRAGHKVRQVESTDERATVEITRKDDPTHPHTATFTIEDAEKAGLVKIVDGKVKARSAKGDPLPWESYTAQMLRNRAISNAGKFACPEVAIGFAIEGDYDYVDEEVEVAQPEHHGDVMDAELVDDPEAVAAALDNIELDFAPPEATDES